MRNAKAAARKETKSVRVRAANPMLINKLSMPSTPIDALLFVNDAPCRNSTQLTHTTVTVGTRFDAAPGDAHDPYND